MNLQQTTYPPSIRQLHRDMTVLLVHLEVRFNNRVIRYQSTSEMIAARDLIRADLGVSQVDQHQRARRLSFTTSKGL